jgi:miniconductance mechanosensitive channel
MDLTALTDLLERSLPAALTFVTLLAVGAFVLARYVLARWFVGFTGRTATQVDDLLVRYLRPARVAWLAPLLVVFALSYLFADAQSAVSRVMLALILWIVAITLISILSAINAIYEGRADYSGVSIAGYLDIAKLVVLFVAIILTVALVTGRSPTALLTGLGAVAAVLMLIFQDTILALVASVQIAANGLLREGDWVEVPAYNADGDVVNINLHTIRVRNWDMTYSIIPTHRIMDVSFRNWRGMVESGGRRIERSLVLDQLSVKFCTMEDLKHLQRIDLIAAWLKERIEALESYCATRPADYDWPLDGPQVTNIEVFREYIVAYLQKREDLHTRDDAMPFIVRVLAPTPTGLPIEVYVFAKTTAWEQYEATQGQIFNHLLAAAPVFGLRVFQEPSGLDFARLVSAQRETAGGA